MYTFAAPTQFIRKYLCMKEKKACYIRENMTTDLI
jgi:hypothetical protein